MQKYNFSLMPGSKWHHYLSLSILVLKIPKKTVYFAGCK